MQLYRRCRSTSRQRDRQIPVCRVDHLAHEIPISHTITPSRTRIPLSRTRLLPSRTRLPTSRTRFQSRSVWTFCCNWLKIVKNGMNEESTRAAIRVREAEKAHNIRTFSHGRGAKKKDPDCIQIRVLLWQITLIWIPMHPTLLPGVHFGMGRGALWCTQGAS